MIDEKRNQRLWVKGCGWTLHNAESIRLYREPQNGAADYLPSPANPVSFTGYLLRDALPKIRENRAAVFDEIACYCKDGKEVCTLRFYDRDDITTSADTLSEAMFLAFEEALLGPQNDQQAE